MGLEKSEDRGSEGPTFVGGWPQTAIITGGIEWDDKVYSFSVARMVRKPRHDELSLSISS
jgi:hypothetical protein